jgi:transcriptional regulator with GAF, ATPase, and Fis domain
MITSQGGALNLRPPQTPPEPIADSDKLVDVERRHIQAVLAKTGWRITGKNGAAEILGLKRTTLQSRMKKLGIQRPSS